MLPIVTYTHCTLGKAHKEEATADGVEVERMWQKDRERGLLGRSATAHGPWAARRDSGAAQNDNTAGLTGDPGAGDAARGARGTPGH